MWNEIDAFKTQLALSERRPRFSFYDGPPFATGLPHYGHILAGTIKDIVTRYATQQGFYVERRFGWDCHGLPVEFEIDKLNGITGPKDVEKMGVDVYNDKCRAIVSRYSREWEHIVKRIGRWIDFDNDYKTLYPWFMESVWWVFKELYNKGLVYSGNRVMPYSTACNTPLSNFETTQNYKEVSDPSVVVSFPLNNVPSTSVLHGASMLAWTTTPWTLPSNLALCVHPDMVYLLVEDTESQRHFVLMEARLSQMYKSEEQYKVLHKMTGKDLKDLSYDPLFKYFAHLGAERGAFRVLNDTYVTSDSGTGVVHQAPYHGEDDFRVCKAAGIITRESAPVCPVDPSGCFMEPVTDFLGQHVKAADKAICAHLKADGRMLRHEDIRHNYPFCWRSNTPLIYKAVPSWFIRVEQARDKLLANNDKTYWVPDFVREKRFANWLRDARDWSVSRNRYWGTPIPLWISEDGEEIVCVGSIEELAQLSGVRVTDLHRETVDQLTIPSRRPGGGVLRRVPEVFDCWFESGSMPYAQQHYPFERAREFEDSFPADFIAEGIDQTRGWFYTLLVISTLLFDKPPFKNLIVNGIVLAEDGEKMSKSKKNYPDPLLVVNQFGADALRLYLINSPVVRADSLRFQEAGVKAVVKDVMLPLYNAFCFLHQIIQDQECRFDPTVVPSSENITDRWILSFSQSLALFVKEEMKFYRLYTVVPRLVRFGEQLTNWFVRMNRKRLRSADDHSAVHALWYVILQIARLLTPFVPFFAEFLYQHLRPSIIQKQCKETESVHYLLLPNPVEALICKDIEESVALMQGVIELGRVIRDRKTLPLKTPLAEVIVIHEEQHILDKVRGMESYILEELNARRLTATNDKARYGVQLRAEPNHKTLGVRYRQDYKVIQAAVKALTTTQLEAYQRERVLELPGGQRLTGDDVAVMYATAGSSAGGGAGGSAAVYEAHSDGNLLVLLDVAPDQTLQDEGMAREFKNRIQKLRKREGVKPNDLITVHYVTESAYLQTVFKQYHDFVLETVGQPMVAGEPAAAQRANVIGSESFNIKGHVISFTLVRRGDSATQPAPVALPENCAVVTLVLLAADGGETRRAQLALENPTGKNALSIQSLYFETACVLGLVEELTASLHLFLDKARQSRVNPHTIERPVEQLAGRTVYVCTQ